MTRYKVKLASIAKLPVGPNGVQMPLCQDCVNMDCSNPIKMVDISIFGVSRKAKLYKSGHNLMAVASCEGYMPNEPPNSIYNI